MVAPSAEKKVFRPASKYITGQRSVNPFFGCSDSHTGQDRVNAGRFQGPRRLHAQALPSPSLLPTYVSFLSRWGADGRGRGG